MPDPAILRSIAAPSQPGPGAPPPAPAGAPEGGAPVAKSEPAALAECCDGATTAITDAKAKLDELVAQAELSDTIDPKVEKLLIKAAENLDAVMEALEEAGTKLGEARDEHEKLVEADDED